MSEVVRIIAAVVDKTQLTLYKVDGSTLVILQGDPRIHDIVEKVIPELEANKFCDMNLDEFNIKSYYQEAEDSMNGFVRFFRAAKKTIDEICARFDRQERPVGTISIGAIPAGETKEETQSRRDQAEATREESAPLTKNAAAVAEIMANAHSPNQPEFHAEAREEMTTVAVLEDNTIIPGIENIEIQLQALAAKLGNPVGVVNFFKRVSSVQRGHSIKDLLTFMSKGELPIADDGSVLVYKRLNKHGEEGVFKDCHSGNVRQRVGSYVFMAEALVDPNRSRDCSNGLHVARRDYLGSFNGNVTVLCKLAPEDVIAVPHSDARKLRAKAYHIIARLSAEDAQRVNNNQPMTDLAMLGDAVAGNHVGILETVEITKAKGGGLVIKAVSEAAEIKPSGKTAKSLDEIEATKVEASSVDPEAVAKNLAKAKSTGKSSRQVQAEALLEAAKAATTSAEAGKAAAELLAFKKKAKVSWGALGLPDNTPERLQKGIDKLKAAEALPKKKPAADKISKVLPDKKEAKPVTTGSPRERIAATVKGGITKAKAAEALAIKKSSKKSWIALGLTEKQVAEIERLTK